MKVAFVGDVHGCVVHALGAVVLLQRHRQIQLDAVVQVGDLGAYPSPGRWDDSSRQFGAGHPAQSDFFRLLDRAPRVAESIQRALEEVPPVLFLSGNHEDHDWLAWLHETSGAAVTPVDPLSAYHHVACGHVADVGGLRTAFLGMIESPGVMDFDADAYDALMAAEPGSIDVLVTHEGPHGMSNDRHGKAQGSAKLSRLIERLQPPVHIGGHYHHENGPRSYGRTASYALGQLVEPKVSRWDPVRDNPQQQVMRGSVGLLDTATLDFEFVHDDWLADVSGDELDLAGLLTGDSPRPTTP
ncbi:metallophosphoesterase family protein [Actinomadura macra]|uniref:metallophosphoesterase family protein n=1 Tax=Actinomadura macra TaxID=46164 RepID=UPI000A062085|nr:metallophosphoesterase [Actinomadura macra]